MADAEKPDITKGVVLDTRKSSLPFSIRVMQFIREQPEGYDPHELLDLIESLNGSIYNRWKDENPALLEIGKKYEAMGKRHPKDAEKK